MIASVGDREQQPWEMGMFAGAAARRTWWAGSSWTWQPSRSVLLSQTCWGHRLRTPIMKPYLQVSFLKRNNNNKPSPHLPRVVCGCIIWQIHPLTWSGKSFCTQSCSWATSISVIQSELSPLLSFNQGSGCCWTWLPAFETARCCEGCGDYTKSATCFLRGVSIPRLPIQEKETFRKMHPKSPARTVIKAKQKETPRHMCCWYKNRGINCLNYHWWII